MKKLFFILTFPILIYTSYVSAKHFWRGTTKSTDSVCKLWGESDFNNEKFKNGTPEDRAKMSCFLLKNQKLFKGKSRSEIRTILGEHDGFYFSDMFPAYLISIGKDRSEASWQLVFMLDRKQKIDEIIVHKNCCDYN